MIHIGDPCGSTNSVNKPKPARYRISNWTTYNDALKKRGSLLIWVSKEMT